MIPLLAQITEDPSKVIGIAKSISEQSLATIIVVLVGLCLGGMGLMLKVFLAKIDRKDEAIEKLYLVIEKIVQDYSKDSAAVTNAVEDLKDAVRDNTSVMNRIQVKLQASVVTLFAIASFLTGCASTPQEKVVRFAAVAQSVAFEGASLWLLEKPQHKDVLKGVVEQLDIAVKAKQFTPIRLVAILRPLNIREMSSKEGRIAIGETIIVWDGLRLSGAIGDTTNLEPVFAGIRDGFQAAIDTTK
jgi:hypothetical protein